MEFKSVPLSGQDPVRARLRQDAARLRALDPATHPTLLAYLRQAYEMSGDKDGAKWVAENTPKSASVAPGLTAADQAISEWQQNHRLTGSSAADREAYDDAQIAESEKWIQNWPDDSQAFYWRFQALRNSQDAPLEDRVKAAQEWIRVYEAHSGRTSPYLQVAQFYAQFNLRFGEIPGVLEKALKSLPAVPPAPATLAPQSDLYPFGPQPSNFQATYNWANTMISAANIYLKVRMTGKARELLGKAGPPLVEALSTLPDTQRNQYQYALNSYWNNMAKLARLEDYKLDALAYERNAMFANASMNSNPSYEESLRRSLHDRFIALGGTEEDFTGWIARPPAPGIAPATSTPSPRRSRAARSTTSS